MPTYLTDSALVLRVTDFSETSQIVALLTRSHGLIPLIAKGAKRQSKKNVMSGPLDLLTLGEVVFIPAKATAELGTLTAWELLDQQPLLRTNLRALNAAMIAIDALLTLLHPLDPHPELYDETAAALQLLPTDARPRVFVAFLKSLLLHTGYLPQLDACVLCNKPITADIPLRFNPTAGGILCGTGDHSDNAPSCSADGRSYPLTGRLAVAMSRLPAPTTLLTTPPTKNTDPTALATAAELLLTHLETISNRYLKTRPLLRTIFELPLYSRP